MNTTARPQGPSTARVLYALILREIQTRYGKHRSGYLWAFMEPAITIVLFGSGFLLLGAAPPRGMHVLPFLITGVGAFFVFQNVMLYTMGAIASGRVFFSYPGVMPFHVTIARGILETLTMISVFFVFLFVGWLFGVEIELEDPLAIVLCLLALSLFGFGLGSALGMAAQFLPFLQRVVPAITRPFLLFSGAFYTAEEIPPQAATYFLVNPLLHAIEILREATFYSHHSIYADGAYLAVCVVGALFFGILLQAALKRRVLCLDKTA
ncbi:ABC transporter permease [Telmatospirillum sp. J64-1]|uniref:ABC transporter permease n=1 Tax=Telmatospirillum sp. J64-1 TaxID=2502183 RepID=UPI00115F340F|nr:ABC transporter permease [Telmatospirillum sp. J64-1]